MSMILLLWENAPFKLLPYVVIPRWIVKLMLRWVSSQGTH
jgi:hypothetical protein